jgi:hypothetical protein
MAIYATIDEIRDIGKSAKNHGALFNDASTKFYKDTFLSYSSKDITLLAGVITLLQNHGASVYVDLDDERLDGNPSQETAAILRSAVKSTNKFVLLVTQNTKDSIWIPWELGIADGAINPESVALFPAVNDLDITSWTTRDYLGLYKRILWGKLHGYANPVWMVYDHRDDTGIELSRWLKIK